MDRIIKRIFGDTFGRERVRLLTSGTETRTIIEIPNGTIENGAEHSNEVKVHVEQSEGEIVDKANTNIPGKVENLENGQVGESMQNVSQEQIKEVVKEPRKVVKVCKIGSDHTFANKNNHDFAFNLLNMKIVTDGCGSGNHSEVGTKIFAQLFARKAKEYHDNGECIDEYNFTYIVEDIFKKMLGLCNDNSFIFQNYCFTILACIEHDEEFVVLSCGDGYIIKENEEGIIFEELDDGEYPAYYVYNFIEDKSVLNAYQDGVSFKMNRYSKQEFMNVGVATDGLRFFEKLLDVEKNKMLQFLHDGKGPQIEKLINRNNLKNGMFHDDISICF